MLEKPETGHARTIDYSSKLELKELYLHDQCRYEYNARYRLLRLIFSTAVSTIVITAIQNSISDCIQQIPQPFFSWLGTA